MNLLEVKNICKTYGNGETAVKALKDVSFSVPKGEYVAIVGESGSGKSTLLNMIGALDTPTSGKVLIDGKDIFSMNDKKLTVFRRRNIGFIFQAFNLVIKIEDYTETTTFSGIDMNAFGKNPTQNELGKMPLLLLGNGSLRDMKDYNNHAISKKQQEKFLEMGENLNIFYSLDEKEKDTSKATDDLTTLSGNSAREPQTSYMPCKAAVVIEGNEIYIPISQAQDLCREIGEPSEISKVYLKINGKNNLENAKKILSGI